MSEMKLSDAIRRGSMLYPQSFGVTFTGTHCCALGAALIAAGVSTEGRMDYFKAFDYFPICGETTAHPVTGTPLLVFSAIRELNDDQKWTRERISEWVATVEASDPVPQTPEGVRADTFSIKEAL